MTELLAEEHAVAEVRAAVRDWLAEHWTSGSDERRFVQEAVDAGWVCPTFPRDLYGRDLPDDLGKVVTTEFIAAGAPPVGVDPIATQTVRAFGTSEELRKVFLRTLLTGESRTCLLYSEPGAGSDLAGLQTRAERDGDHWVVNGQKVWTSGAHHATHGLLIARTDWEVPKHKGISFFVIPMRQDGVEVRPIRQMTGHATFSEVFFTDAQTPDAYRLGGVNDGWRVLQTALAVERMMLGGSGLSGGARQTRAAQGAAREATLARPHVDFVALARGRGRAGDDSLRQAIARLHSLERIGKWSARRASGMADEKVACVLKLGIAEVLHTRARIFASILGTEAMLSGTSSADAEEANQSAMWAFPISIGGGSDQIQRNIIGERVLGLPHDPSVDRDIPFRDVRTSPATRRFS